MAKLPRTLFLSVPIGSGHTRAAQALNKSILEQSNVLVEPKLLDIFDYLDQRIWRAVIYIYLKNLELSPWIYGRMYNWGNKHKYTLSGRNMLNSYLAVKLAKYIKLYQPAIIVCTHATAAGITAQLIRGKQIAEPVVTVITDFTVHKLWFYPEISLYYAADKRISSLNTITDGKINCFGILVDGEFGKKYDKLEFRRQLGFAEHLPTILIMGGGSSILPIDRIVAICDQLTCRLQIIAVAGNNLQSTCKLNLQKNVLKNTAYIYGFSHNIHELMAVADLLISKSGGITSSEAICMGLPMVIFRPIPGQEATNAEYLLASNIAWQANSYDELRTVLERLFINEPQLLPMRSRQVLSQAKPNASKDIAKSILGLINDCC